MTARIFLPNLHSPFLLPGAALPFFHRSRFPVLAGLLLILGLVPGVIPAVLAQPAPPAGAPSIDLPQEPLDNLRQLTPDWEQRYLPPGQQHPTPPPAATPSKHPPTVTDADLLRHPQLAEIVLTTAIKRHDWNTVKKVLGLYETIPGHDRLLVHYGKGALLRSQRRHGEAIGEYRAMLQADPGLHTVRFDLGIMLFEDKQYRAAQEQLKQSLDVPGLPAALRGIAQQILDQIAQAERIRPLLRIRLLHSNNINQRGDASELAIGGLLFEKNPDSMPKASWGMHYALQLDQEVNLGGNNFLAYSASANKLDYASASDYDENAVMLSLDYKHQTVSSWVALGPAMQWQWLAGQRYSHGQGLNASIGHWISPRLQASAYMRWLHRSYYDPNLASYEGDTSSVSPGLLWLVSRQVAVLVGAGYLRESLRTGSESFRQSQVNVGMNVQVPGGFNASAFAQLGFRRYDERHPLMYEWRKDRRFTTSLTIGHGKLQVAGFEPKLGVQYERVHSNIAGLYSRSTWQSMLTLERRF